MNKDYFPFSKLREGFDIGGPSATRMRSPLKKIGKKLPVIEPDMKLTPTIKLIGKEIVSCLNKLTFPLLELFCIPIINNKNKQELKVIEKINLLNASDISYIA